MPPGVRGSQSYMRLDLKELSHLKIKVQVQGASMEGRHCWMRGCSLPLCLRCLLQPVWSFTMSRQRAALLQRYLSPDILHKALGGMFPWELGLRRRGIQRRACRGGGGGAAGRGCQPGRSTRLGATPSVTS